MTTVGSRRPTTVRQRFTIAGLFGTAAGLGLVPGALLLLSELVRGSYDGYFCPTPRKGKSSHRGLLTHLVPYSESGATSAAVCGKSTSCTLPQRGLIWSGFRPEFVWIPLPKSSCG